MAKRRAPFILTLIAAATVAAGFAARKAPVSEPVKAAPSSALWREAREKLGGGLVAQMAPDGRVYSVRGRPGSAAGHAAAAADFRSDDPRKTIGRAKDILRTLEGSLGVTPDFPLARPVARGNEASAQVYFEETYEGVPIRPYGKVIVDLSAQGDLLRVDSNYIPQPGISGSRSLSVADCKLRAMASVGGSRAEGGDPVIWVMRESASGPAIGRYAYDYSVGGVQVVVDAESGKVLFQRDRRQF